MAWTALTFAFGSLLTSTKMTQLFDNLAALAAQDSGAPTLYWNVGWINFDGTGTISILDSHNVISIVDDGSGKFTINWDTDFSSANYATAGMSGVSAGRNFPYIVSKLAGSISIGVSSPAGSDEDTDDIGIIATGDQ